MNWEIVLNADDLGLSKVNFNWMISFSDIIWNQENWFQLYFTVQFLNDFVTPQTNAKMWNTRNKQLGLSDVFTFLACIFFMTYHEGVIDCRDWWMLFPSLCFYDFPDELNQYISRWRIVRAEGFLTARWLLIYFLRAEGLLTARWLS